MSDINPIELTKIETPLQARATLNKDQVIAFQNLLGGSNLISLPEGKSVADVQTFMVSVQGNGDGFLNVTIK